MAPITEYNLVKFTISSILLKCILIHINYIKQQNKFEFFLNINSHFLVILYYFGSNTIKISFIITVLCFSCNDKCLVYLLLEGLTAVYYAILERERTNYCFFFKNNV